MPACPRIALELAAGQRCVTVTPEVALPPPINLHRRAGTQIAAIGVPLERWNVIAVEKDLRVVLALEHAIGEIEIVPLGYAASAHFQRPLSRAGGVGDVFTVIVHGSILGLDRPAGSPIASWRGLGSFYEKEGFLPHRRTDRRTPPIGVCPCLSVRRRFARTDIVRTCSRTCPRSSV